MGRLQDILSAVGTAYDMPVEVLVSRKRTASVSLARGVFCWIARERGATLEEIGEVVGRDHTTIMYTLSRIQQRIQREEAVKSIVDSIQKRFPPVDDEVAQSRSVSMLCLYPSPKAGSILQRLVATGLWGASVEETAMRLLDEALRKHARPARRDKKT